MNRSRSRVLSPLLIRSRSQRRNRLTKVALPVKPRQPPLAMEVVRVGGKAVQALSPVTRLTSRATRTVLLNHRNPRSSRNNNPPQVEAAARRTLALVVATTCPSSPNGAVQWAFLR
jgi:hypothetical protein